MPCERVRKLKMGLNVQLIVTCRSCTHGGETSASAGVAEDLTRDSCTERQDKLMATCTTVVILDLP